MTKKPVKAKTSVKTKPTARKRAKASDAKLVIVESPAKARTVERMLSGGYSVKASVGHVRDLPPKWLGVDVKKGFTPRYEVPKEKREVVEEIKDAASKASAVYLATDPDREGEAIAWHLVQAAKLENVTLKRVVFHEITKEAVEEAFDHPREIDMDLVYAQQARRILDRLVGYKISPLLWQKVRRGLSAGRVQSVALRMVVDREREIEGFVPKEYWSIDANLKKLRSKEGLTASLVGLKDGKKPDMGSKAAADEIVSQLKDASYSVLQIRKKEVSRQPAPPFTTSTLQQEGWRKLRFSANHTMALAQHLYEGLPIGNEGSVGLITYMRTDSVKVAHSAVAETRDYIKGKYGASFLPPHPRAFRKKAKGAQEAHEAIRPTSVRRDPAAIKEYLSRDQFRLYELIWKRMVSCQMAPATLDTITIDIEARREKDEKSFLLRAASSTIKFLGFTILYSEGRDEDENEEGKTTLPKLTEGEALKLLKLIPEQHFTQPPPRYSQATLIKTMEEWGIGRPSTYAPTLATIKDRDYVAQETGRFHPTELGLTVSDMLSKHFPNIVDFGFTSQMEEDLDRIAQGKRKWVPFLEAFYNPFEKTLATAKEQMEKVKIADEPTDEVCDLCGKPMVIKTGRYGKFIACSGYPECKNTKPLLAKTGVNCPQCGRDLVERKSRKKLTFYGCSGYPQCDFTTSNRPIPQPCPQCGGLLVMRGKRSAKCIKCEFNGPLAELKREAVKV